MKLIWKLILFATVALLPAAAAAQTHPLELENAKVIVKYDKFTDYTFVAIRPLEVPITGGGMLTLMMSLAYKGQVERGQPEAIFLTFYSFSSDWRFLNHDSMIALADGERIRFGPTNRTGKVENGGVTEDLTTQIDLAMLKKLAAAKSLEFKVGHYEVALTADQIAILQELRDRASTH